MKFSKLKSKIICAMLSIVMASVCTVQITYAETAQNNTGDTSVSSQSENSEKSLIEPESDEIKAFLAEMMADGLTQDNSAYDLSAITPAEGTGATDLVGPSQFALTGNAASYDTNNTISLASTVNPIQSDTYKRVEVGDSINLDTWFSALGISGAAYKIIDELVGNISGSTLTVTHWGKTQVTATSGNNFRVIELEARPQGAFAMPMVAMGMNFVVALKADGTTWSWGTNYYGQLSRTAGGNYAPHPMVYQDGSPINDIIQIAAGGWSTYFLKPDGTVWSCGYNGSSNLGVGWQGSAYNYPIQLVTGAQGDASTYLQNIVSISSLYYNAYAIETTGKVLSWGYGGYWALGAGTTRNQHSPVYVSGSDGTYTNHLTNVIDVKSGNSSAMFLLSNGTVAVTGYNSSHGGLGDGTSNYYAYPKMVIAGEGPASGDNLGRIVELAVADCSDQNNYNTFFALSADGRIYTWGYGTYCATGLTRSDGTNDTTNYTSPKHLAMPNGKTAIHIVATTCGNVTDNGGAAMTADRKIYTWGGTTNNYGQRGNGSTTAISAAPLLTIDKISDLNATSLYSASSFNYACIKEDGTVWGWGMNEQGQMGIGSTGSQPEPVCAGGIMGTFLDISNATVSGGTTPPVTYNEAAPMPVTITLAEDQILNINASTIQKYDKFGFSLLEIPKQPLAAAATFSSTDTSIATVTADGMVIPNSQERYGEATIVVREGSDNNGTIGMIRVRIKPRNTFTMPMVSAGYGYAVAVKVDGSAWAWGLNTCGECCIGSYTPSNVMKPMRMVDEHGNPLTNVLQVQAGYKYGVLLHLDDDGGTSVWTWGCNNTSDGSYGLLGIGTSSGQFPYPVQVVTGEQKDSSGYLRNIARISASSYNCYAISNTGEIFGWGYNVEGTIGDNSGSMRTEPTRPKTLTERNFENVLDVQSTEIVVQFLRTNGTVFACGRNGGYGGIGDDTGNHYYYPVQVKKGESPSASDYLSNVFEIAVSGRFWADGAQSFFALNTDKEVYSWGYGGNYSLGHGPQPILDANGNPTFNSDGSPKMSDGADSSTMPKKITALDGKNIVHIVGMEDIDSKSYYYGAMAIAGDGSAYTWGGTSNAVGQLGNGTDSTLHKTPALTTPKAFGLVTVSGGHAGYAGMKQDGTVWCWGWNNNGQVGDGTFNNAPEATEVNGKGTSSKINVDGSSSGIYRGSSIDATWQ